MALCVFLLSVCIVKSGWFSICTVPPLKVCLSDYGCLNHCCEHTQLSHLPNRLSTDYFNRFLSLIGSHCNKYFAAHY